MDWILSLLGTKPRREGREWGSEGNQGNGVKWLLVTLPRKELCGKRERKEDEVFVLKGRGSGERKEEEKLKRETREDDSANAESAVLLTNYVTWPHKCLQAGGVTAHAHKYYQNGVLRGGRRRFSAISRPTGVSPVLGSRAWGGYY